MEVCKILHMNSGDGDKGYAKNSLLQQKVISMAWPIIKETVEDFCSTQNIPITTLSMADLGCSSGSNTLMIISNLIKQVELHTNKPTQYQIFFNDLPSNDFNAIFRSLPNFLQELKNQVGDDFGNNCFFNGVSGSFYGRLFPNKSLHFVHSSYSVHWLSQVPQGMEIINKGNIFIDSTSPKNVIKGYYKQFQKDFSLFLKCRGEEIVTGGRMVFTILGRTDEYPPNTDYYCYDIKFMNLVLNGMVREGLIKEEKADRFNIPKYRPSPKEVKTEILKEGSFMINRVQVSRIDWNFYNNGEFDELLSNNNVHDVVDSSYYFAKCIRSVYEPLFISHFGEAIVDELFQRYSKMVKYKMSNKKYEYVNLTMSLTKI